MFFKFLKLSSLFLLLLSSCEEVQIIIDPPEKIKGSVFTYLENTSTIKNSRITLHEINSFDFLNESSFIREEYISDDSSFLIRLPRHEVPSTNLILRVISPIAGGMPLYGFAGSRDVEVSIFSTVIYELIVTNTSVNVIDFTSEQIQELIEAAKNVFYLQVTKHHIQLNYSIPKIYKALKNALSASTVFMEKYNSLTRRNILAEHPFGWTSANLVPIIQARNPFVIEGSIVGMLETQSKFFDLTAVDIEGQQLFYVWYFDGVLISNEENFDTFYKYETNYSSAGTHNLKVEISDGGLYTSFTWTIRVANKNRAPRIITECLGNSNLTEDVSYTCLIEAVDDDGDYPIAFEGFYYDTSDAQIKETTDYPISGLPQCAPGIENCVDIVNDRSAFFTFTPTNCQTGNHLFNLTLLDSYFDIYAIPQAYDRSSSIFSILFTTIDINNEPEFLSFVDPDDINIIENDITDGVPVTFDTTESYEFIKVIKVSDIDAISVAGGGTNDDGDLCADNLILSFDTKPTSMSLTSLYTENGEDPAYFGLYRIRWRPRSDQINTSLGNLVKLKLTDAHGGLKYYQFYVKVNNIDQGPVLMSRIPTTYNYDVDGNFICDCATGCSNYFDPSKVYDYSDPYCIPKYIMEEYIQSRWNTSQVSEITLRSPEPAGFGSNYQSYVKVSVPGRDDYTSPLEVYENSNCPGTGVNAFSISELKIFLYHGDSNHKISFDAQIIEPNPLPPAYNGLTNQGNFTSKFIITKGWGGALDENGDPDPDQAALPQKLHFFPQETTGGFSYAFGKFSWCINDIDTELNDIKVRITVCDDDQDDEDPTNGANDCDYVDMMFDLPEMNQAPVFAFENLNQNVEVNYMDRQCCDINGTNCAQIADCGNVAQCYDTHAQSKSWCQDSGITPFQITVTDPDGDSIECSFDNQSLADQLGLLINENNCTISSISGKPDWDNISNHSIKINAVDIVPLEGEPGYIAPGPITSSKTFSLNVSDVNYPPYITSTPTLTAQDGTQYVYDITVDDPNINPNYKKSVFDIVAVDPIPSNMSIESTCLSTSPYTCTGKISWIPTDMQAIEGTTLNLQVKATDCEGACAGGEEKSYSQDLNILLHNVNQPPVVFSLKNEYTMLADGRTYSFIVSAVDPDNGDIVSISSDVGTLENYIDNSGVSGAGIANLSASITPSQGQVSSTPYTLTYSAQDNHGLSSSDLLIDLNILNTNKILSIAPKQAQVGLKYSYEVKGTKEVDNLTYSVVNTDIACSFVNNNFLEFTPNSANAGNTYSITIRVTDGDYHEDQSWQVKVKSMNSAPLIDTIDPNCDDIISYIENDVFIIGLSLIDLDSSDKLLTSFYVDDVWIMDKESSMFPDEFNFSYYFDKVSQGAHSIYFTISDGISTLEKTCNLNIKNSYPVFNDDNFKDFSTKTLGLGIVNDEINAFITSTDSASGKKVAIFDDFSDIGSFNEYCSLSFEPQRVVIDTSNITPTNYKVYFAKYGDPDAANNEFVRYRSVTTTCDSSVSYSSNVFSLNAFSSFGGVKFADIDVGGIKRYYVKEADKTKVKIQGYPTEISLSDEVSNVYTIDDKGVVIALMPNIELISVIDPNTNTVIENIDLSILGTPDLIEPFMALYYDNILYIYSTNGVISLIYLNEVDFFSPPANYVMIHFSGFPTNMVVNNEHNLMHYNTLDNLFYLMTPSSKKFTIWDLGYSYRKNILDWSDTSFNYNYFFYKDDIQKLFLLDKDEGKIIDIK